MLLVLTKEGPVLFELGKCAKESAGPFVSAQGKRRRYLGSFSH